LEVRCFIFRSKSLRAVTVLLALAIRPALPEQVIRHEKLSKKEHKELIASVTPADHQRIAAHYRLRAQHLVAKEHEEERELAEYDKNPIRYPSKYPTMGDRCRSLATYYKTAAHHASTLADLHEKLSRQPSR
jgi:hypothetical protein